MTDLAFCVVCRLPYRPRVESKALLDCVTEYATWESRLELGHVEDRFVIGYLQARIRHAHALLSGTCSNCHVRPKQEQGVRS